MFCLDMDEQILKDFVFTRICNAITKSHPQRSDVYKSDLDKTLPNIQEIQAAFVKLKQLCVNGNDIFILYTYIMNGNKELHGNYQEK